LLLVAYLYKFGRPNIGCLLARYSSVQKEEPKPYS
jgi:hypothetical protein